MFKSRSELTQQHSHRIHAQHGGMLGGGLQSVQQLGDHVGGQLGQLLGGATLHPFRKCGSRGDGRGAAPCLVTYLGYASGLKNRGKDQAVTTGRVRNIHRLGRCGQRTEVARILEVIEEPW